MAYLRKRGKNWHIIDIDPVTKKHREKSLKTSDRSIAESIIKKENSRKELEMRTRFMDIKKEKITPLQALDLYHNRKRRKRKLVPITDATKSIYKYAVNKWTEVCGDKPVDLYTEEDYNNFIDHLSTKTSKYKREFKTNTIANYCDHLYILFNWLEKERYIKSNPISQIEKEDSEIEVIPQAILKRIYKNLLEENKEDKITLIKLTHLCAFRASEIVTAEKEDFDLKNKIIYVRNSKGRRMDIIPMLEDIYTFLKKLSWSKIPAGRLFKFVRADGMKTFWKHAQRGLKKTVKFHSLRRTRATELANSGIDLFFLHKFMRHKDIRTTMKYYAKEEREKMRASMNSKIKVKSE